MHTWHTFIQSQTLNTQASPLAPSALYPLAYDFIEVQGSDAEKLLQGQFSCDVRLVTAQHASLGSHSNAKGRMISSFRINAFAPNHYLLALPQGMANIALPALKKYSAFSKSQVLANENTAAFGFHFPADVALNAIPLPERKDYAQRIENQCLIVCTSTQYNSYEVYGPSVELQKLWQQLQAQLPLFSAQQQQLLHHHLGLAFVHAASSDKFIAQMFNYQHTPVLSFTKGCYTGQEIIARSQYLGKLKRSLYRFTCQASALHIGDELRTEEERAAGTLVSAVAIGENQWDVLAVLSESSNTQNSFYTAENTPLQAINWTELSYTD